MLKMYKFILLAMMLFGSIAFAQTYTVSGEVTSVQNGDKLIGANVYVKGVAIGAATDADGRYEFNVPAGTYDIVCSYIGFETEELLNVEVTNNMELNFELQDHEFSLSVTVLADRVKERETPVAYTNIEKKDVEFKLGSQDVPMVLNTTPSVYATMGGGGAGDARINIRGFDQRNVAIMINGVPINDMENGWVYWSNWDGVGDATSSIQIQRGLSAVNLATPSIGGTMNVITDPTANKFGGKFKQEFGNDAFLKSTLIANSGLIDNKWAVSAVIVKKTGDGLIDKTWTDAWAYYFGASYNLNKSNRLELYALGAPQRHGQNLYRQNAAAYDHDYARDELGFTQEALDAFPEASAGRYYNENWGPVSSSYTGKQWSTPLFAFSGDSGGEIDRYDPNFLNERENFFHKPIVNLNWYSQLAKDFSLYTTAYWSGGIGGGTGTFGSMRWNYHVGIESPSRFVAWDATIENNINNGDGGSLGILRNSRNDQWTIGVISKAYYKINDNFKTSFGVDWRTAEIDHYREVRDLLGGQYYVDNSDVFSGERQLQLGDKFNYYNTNTVDWIGGYVQGEYSKDRWSAFVMGGYSTIKYTFTDHFNSTTGDASGEEVYTETDPIGGYQVKGGASYRLSSTTDVYFNGGYVAKVPIFDAVIDDGSGAKADDPENEKFTSFEAGMNYRSPDGKVALKGNVYYTTWLDRTISRGITNQDGSEGLVFLTGLDSRHYGIEIEAALQPIRMARLDVAMSFGNWKTISDVNARYRDYSSDSDVEYNLYLDGLRTGDQPQTSVVGSLSLFPVEGLAVSGIVKHYRDYYAGWSVTSRTNPDDRQQSWKAPAYTVVDLHATYDLPIDLEGVSFQVFGHVFNLLDEIYVQDATDNSDYNAYSGNGKTHAADDAEVYLGLPRSFNAGISILF